MSCGQSIILYITSSHRNINAESLVGMAIFSRFQLHKTLGCSEAVMQNWLTLIEANYKRSNAYHNSTHAADVLHSAAYFLEQVIIFRGQKIKKS